MIPKIIHSCWLSGEPYPEEIQKCIDSWHKFLPDYEYRLWTKENFNLSINPWVEESFREKKYAFTSDYIRLYVLYNYGGVYLDSDLEVLKPIDDLLYNKAFMGRESSGRLAAWIFGCEKGNPVIKKLLDDYNGRHYTNEKDRRALIPNTISVTTVMSRYGVQPEDVVQRLDDITVYSSDYFSPYKPWCKEENITINSYMKHHYAGSWKNAQDIAFWNYIMEIPYKLKMMVRSVSNEDMFIIYGFGIAGNVVYEKLDDMGLKKRIKCFAVSAYDTDWRSNHGIPLLQLEEMNEDYTNDIVILATPPKYHADIKRNLTDKGFRRIECLT